jgi:hypothetical protein
MKMLYVPEDKELLRKQKPDHVLLDYNSKDREDGLSVMRELGVECLLD